MKLNALVYFYFLLGAQKAIAVNLSIDFVAKALSFRYHSKALGMLTYEFYILNEILCSTEISGSVMAS